MNETVDVSAQMSQDDAEYLAQVIERGGGRVFIYTPSERWLVLFSAFAAGFISALLLVTITNLVW